MNDAAESDHTAIPDRKGPVPVCIFAKPPIPGQVKTRIAQRIGDAAAAQLAGAMLRDVWSVVQRANQAMPVVAAAEAGELLIEGPVWLQQAGDLGWRIEGILRRGLQSASATIALGADTPLLTPNLIQQAIDLLQTYDAVLGPSWDGGFYLLGLRSCPEGLLSALPWSREDTCNATERRLQQHGMRVAKLPRLPDVDTLQDLEHLRKNVGQLQPHTREWLLGTSW